jgi:hypothetical protein
VLNATAGEVVLLRATATNNHATAAQYVALVEGVTALPSAAALAGLTLIQATSVAAAGGTATLDFGVSGYHTNGPCVLVGLSSLTPPTYCASDMSFVSYVSTIS